MSRRKSLYLSGLILMGVSVFVFMYSVRNSDSRKKIFGKKSAAVKTDSTEENIFYSLDTFFTYQSIQHEFSGSVLISLRGNPVYEKCFGYCDYRNKNLMSDTNAFQLASVSKTFTGTAVLWCVEQGLLLPDDSLKKFFPEIPYPNVRIKDLLCHRSGLPNYIYFCSAKCRKGEFFSNDDVLNVMLTQAPAPYAKPDKKFEYCNTNFMLLALVIEKVTQKKFSAFMHETFFEPLGMKHTFIYSHSDSLSRKIATSYNSKWQIQNDDCFDGVVGDKGVYSIVHDLFLWDQAFYAGKILSQEMMKEAYTPRSFEKPGKRNYGYGWRLLMQPDGNYLVYHNGWWHGNNTVFYRNIQDTTSIIILSNKYNKWVYHVQPVFDILYGMKSDTIGFGEE